VHGSEETRRIVRFYADAWIHGDLDAARQMIDPDAEIEWNLDAPVDDEELAQTLCRMSAFADSVEVVSEVVADGRAALIYDCAAPFGTARVVELLAVADGKITEVRQTHDLVAVRRYFPGLVG
jgi:ketosteroid isomerase-like protein